MVERFSFSSGPEQDQESIEKKPKPHEGVFIIHVGENDFEIPKAWLIERVQDLFPKFGIDPTNTPDAIEFFILRSLGAEMSDKLKMPKEEIHEIKVWKEIVKIIRREVDRLEKDRERIIREYQNRKK